MIFVYLSIAITCIVGFVVIVKKHREEFLFEQDILNTSTEELEKRLEALEECHKENTMKITEV